MHNMEKKFPSYFKNFELPAGESHTPIKVYRACRTLKADAQSFLPTFEENGFQAGECANPSEYSLSTYEKPKDVKRFAATNSKYDPPWKIAVGSTALCCGVSQRTKDWIGRRYKNSHVDWWLYEDAVPHEHFELIDNFEDYYNKYRNGENENEQ